MSQFGDLFSIPIFGFENGKKLKQCNSVFWLLGEHLDPETNTNFDSAVERKAEPGD